MYTMFVCVYSWLEVMFGRGWNILLACMFQGDQLKAAAVGNICIVSIHHDVISNIQSNVNIQPF